MASCSASARYFLQSLPTGLSRPTTNRRVAIRRAHRTTAVSQINPAFQPSFATNASHQEAPSSYKRDPELQAALDALFADSIHRGRRRVPHSEVQPHLQRICQLASRLGLDRVHPEWNDGAFQGLLTSQLTGITTDNRCSLSRLTFGRVQPGQLEVQTD
ncbi:hypothetical protein Agub_g8730, partial [Astrephomene gubernaculifera]